MNNFDEYKIKYLKYKNKYLTLKAKFDNIKGGTEGEWLTVPAKKIRVPKQPLPPVHVYSKPEIDAEIERFKTGICEIIDNEFASFKDLIISVYLFGSWANPSSIKPNSDSDLDVLILLKPSFFSWNTKSVNTEFGNALYQKFGRGYDIVFAEKSKHRMDENNPSYNFMRQIWDLSRIFIYGEDEPFYIEFMGKFIKLKKS